jgi:hypothetical protein
MRFLRGIVALAWGALLCQTAVSAVLVVGWTYRLARQSVLARWQALAGTTEARHPGPRWFLGEGGGATRRLVGSFLANLRVGLRAAMSVWLVTLPGSALLYLGWSNGWNTSFSRIYEDIALGPLTMLAGTLLLIVVLVYMPLASIHQAVAEDWRAFFQVGLVSRLIRRRPWSCVGLAVLYGVLSLPLLVLTVGPLFLPNLDPRLEALTPAEATEWLNLYYLTAGVLLFPLFLLPRLAAARIYAGAVASAVRQGRLAPVELPAAGRVLLETLPIEPPRVRRPVLIRWAQATVGATAAVAIVILTVAAWAGLVSQIVVAQFFHYRGALGWLNHPMVQLPWLSYVPDLPM